MSRVLGLLAMIGPAATAAATVEDAAARFAARPTAYRAAMSPDGSKILYLTAFKTGGTAVIVADIATGKLNLVMASADPTLRPSACRFKSETRLICTLYGLAGGRSDRQDFTRTVGVDTDGGKMRVLGQDDTARSTSTVYDGGAVIDYLPDDPKHLLMQVDVGSTRSTGTHIKGEAEGRAAALVDIDTGLRSIVERGGMQTSVLQADGQARVRLRGLIARDANGYVRDRMTYSVRAKGSSEWRPLGTATLGDPAAMSFEGFDESGDNVYQIKPLDGRRALYKVAADGSGKAELVFAHPRYDVDDVLRIGRNRRPVAVTYASDRYEGHYFDPALAALDRALGKALPGNPAVATLDESWDGRRKLILAQTGNNPGRYYMFDTTTKTLAELVAVRPALDGVALGTVRAVSYPAADGTVIPAYLTLPPGKDDARGLPALLMPHGGPAARDTLRFDWLAQFFSSQGYAVLQPNFRGSTGYGVDFFAKNGFQSWRLAIGDIDDGARWLVRQGIADAGRLAIFGWSYGGYAALQANVIDSNLYKAAIAVAPVTDLPLLREEHVDWSDYKLVDSMIGTGDHVIAGSPARHAAAFEAPVLIFHGDRDLNVDIAQSRAMVAALKAAGKRVDFVEIKGLDHQLDDSVVRRDMLTKSAAFLAAAMH